MALRLRVGFGLAERPFGPAAPPAWTPLALPGLALWLAADGMGTLRDDANGDGYTGWLGQAPAPSGTWFVSQWDDMSGQGRDAVQPAVVSQPELVPNAIGRRPAVRFDGATTVLGLPTLAGLTAGEAFVVLRVNSDPPGDAVRAGLWHLGTATAGVRYPDTDGVIRDGFGATDLKTTADPAASLAQAHVYNVTSRAGEWTSRLNGVELFTTAISTVGFAAVPVLGKSLDEAYLDGDLHEVLLCDPLDPATRDQALRYLAGKYGVSLP